MKKTLLALSLCTLILSSGVMLTACENSTFTIGDQSYDYSTTEVSVNDQSVNDLSALKECEDLVSLKLDNCSITSLDEIAKLEGLTCEVVSVVSEAG